MAYRKNLEEQAEADYKERRSELNQDLEAEVAELLAHIERCTGFALLDRKRDVIMIHARAKLDRTRQAFLEAKAARKSVSTSRRAYLTDL